jgi:hypothetical protein
MRPGGADDRLTLPFGFLGLLLGTFLPSLRASDRPMAIACLRLFTFLPEPLFSVPVLRSCITFSTFLEVALEYFRAMIFSLQLWNLRNNK